MITIHYGKLGAGKSYSATCEVWKMIHKGRDCYVNWKINFTDYYLKKRKSFWYRLWNPVFRIGNVYYWETLEELYKLRNGEVFFDEAHMSIDARDFAKLPPKFKRKLTQSRKYGLNLHFISQHTGQIDIAVRRLANDCVEHKKFWRLFYWKEYDGEQIEKIIESNPDRKPKSIGLGWYWFRKSFAKSYNTFALFDEFDAYSGQAMWSPLKVLEQKEMIKRDLIISKLSKTREREKNIENITSAVGKKLF